jgi:hypothetical protein
VSATANGVTLLFGQKPHNANPPELYYAVQNMHFMVSTREVALKRAMLREQARRRTPPTGDPVSASLFLSPAAAGEPLRAVFREALIRQGRNQAYASAATWDALYRAGAIAPNAGGDAADSAAIRHLGFVPTAPDGSLMKFAAKVGETGSTNYGTPRQPAIPDGPGLAAMVEMFQSARIDLLLLKDGVRLRLIANLTPAPAPAARAPVPPPAKP